MSTRHKQIPLVEQTFEIPTASNGLRIIPQQIDHVGKSNHFIDIRFQVSQPNPNMVHDIILFVLDESQLINWMMFGLRSSNHFLNPQNSLFCSGQTDSLNHRVEIAESKHIYFLLDNRYSSVTRKTVNLSIYEEWDEMEGQLDVVTTIPPHDDSLRQGVERLISSSVSDLKIITPYIDMSLVSQLLAKHRDGVSIQIITRDRKEFVGKGAKEAFNHVNKNLVRNHKTNEHIHSRLMICDGNRALVSSADLTQDSLLGQFNAGVLVSEPEVIRKLLDYFKKTWDASSLS